MFFLASSLFAGPREEKRLEPVQVVIYGLKGPSGVGLAKVFETPPSVPGYVFSTEALPSADLMAARLISGEAKIGVLPPNTAAKIAFSGKRLRVAAVLGNGMLALLSNNGDVNDIASLKGKKIAVAGHGAVPEYVFRKILESNRLFWEKDMTPDFSLTYPEIAAGLIAGRVETALLPEPFATMARTGSPATDKPALHDVFDVQAEWAKAPGSSGANYPISVLVVDGDFADRHPAAVGALLAAARSSQEWVLANPKEAGVLVESLDWGLKAGVVSAAIPKSNYVFEPALAARPALEDLFRAFLEYAPEAISSKENPSLPPDSFYYRPVPPPK
jgi:NitT/TauT family transport system substrate-binding protein